MNTFGEKLEASMLRNRSLLCVGLDVHPEQLPISNVVDFGRAIVEATADLVCAYKPNLAFYEALGLKGLRSLEQTLTSIPSHIPIIGDGKRSDIGSTAKAYARALFQSWGFDAATVNPYLGSDSVEPFLEYVDKGTFILCRTSNPGSGDFQSLLVDGTPLYEAVAVKAQSWNKKGNVGLVVGATYPDELKRIRALCPLLPILIPGIGTQGGDISTSVRVGMDSRGLGAIVNVSRQVLYAAKGKNFAEAARRVADDLRQKMEKAREAKGFRW